MTVPSPAEFPDQAAEARAIVNTAGSAAAGRAKGIVLTPPSLATALAEACLPEHHVGELRVLDPACGTGRLLVAARSVAARRGLTIACVGVECEPALAAIARDALPGATIHTGDAMALPRTEHFDVILMNPPYRGRMRKGDAQATKRASALEARFGSLVGPYTDPSTGFMLLAAAHLARAGRLGAIVPVSIVAARDARPARTHLAARLRTLDCWMPTNKFDADVRTVCLVLEQGDTEGPCDWASRLAAAAGVPGVTAPARATIGDVATATADFRDEYYALQTHVVEQHTDASAVPLITCGLIDPGASRHGSRRVKAYGRTWTAPAVRRHADIQAQLQARLVPKVLVATQTRIIEPLADPGGRLLPGTPVIRVVPRSPAQVQRVAVSLLAPQASALALHRHVGSGRAPLTLRLRAADIDALPLVPESEALDHAAGMLVKATTLRERAQAAALAWGDDARIALDWWLDRLPKGVDPDAVQPAS